MAARTVSELANWDGHQRQNAKWRCSSTLARDSYQAAPENQSIEATRPPSKISGQKRAEKSTFRPNFNRDSLANSPANARLPSHVDTTSTSSHALHHSHQTATVRIALNPASRSSSFTVSSKSSHRTPNSSVHASRAQNPRAASSREHIPLSQPGSTIESDVIDLTLEDTEDELSVTDMLVPNSTRFTDPGPSRRTRSSRHSPPIAPEQSLFTPPPPSRRRIRRLLPYVAVPSFRKGLTKADYQPMFDHALVPPPAPNTTSTHTDSSPVESSVTQDCASQKQKGKEPELDVISSHEEYKRPSVNGPEVISNGLLDAFFGHMVIPLYDDDTYPPLTTLDLVTNSRFQFAQAWRAHASALREVELDQLLGKVCIWAQSTSTPSPRLPGTAGYVTSEELRPWELVLPESSSEEKENMDHAQDEQEHARASPAPFDGDSNCLSPPNDVVPGPSAASRPTSSITSQGLTAVDMEHDMHRFFNGLGDSPTKYVAPRQQLAPTHTFRPHLLQSSGRAQVNSFGLDFPSLELDPRLADTGDRECFLGVPPSPPPTDMVSSTALGSISDPPFASVDFPASSNNLFEASPTGAWSFEQGESLLPDNDPPPNDHATPPVLGTIDPSLLDPEQSPKPSPVHKHSTPKLRSKLPEPVIYIRRPIDSSSLPLLSGKRAVQIKYRDSGGFPATPSTQAEPNEAQSGPAQKPTEQPMNNTDDSPRARRRSAPSRKLREYCTASESSSDYVPEPSTSKLRIKIKRPSLRDKELDAEYGDVATKASTPAMSYCHQCRNKSVRPKMLCSNVIHSRVCGKRFCNRCILYRYPDITFDEHSAGFLCPVCTNTCNCSFCSRSRGEEFVSMRLGGLAASLLKTKVTLVRDIESPHRTQSPPGNAQQSASVKTTPTPESGTLPPQPQFWAHVYGVEGERMGSAFMTREHMERLQTRGPPPPPPLSNPAPKKVRKPKRDKEREKPKGPRVFIGCPLASWKILAERDLEPSVDVESWSKGKGKARETTGGRQHRCYVGNPTPLHEPYGRMPGTANPSPPSSRCSTPAFGSEEWVTPLSNLEDNRNWPQPKVGEYCSWAPPPPPGAIAPSLSTDLSDLSGLPGPELPSAVDLEVGDEQVSPSTTLSSEDVARAISAALAALSVDPPS